MFLVHESNDANELGKQAALATLDYFREARRRRPESSMSCALSGGTSPMIMLKNMAELARDSDVARLWKMIHWFQVDERLGSKKSDRSNFEMLERYFLGPVQIPADHIYRMPDDTHNPEHDASLYERRLREIIQKNGLDLIVLGMGEDGHTASLFPHTEAICNETDWVAFVPASKDREARMSLLPQVILSAKECFVLVSGEKKRDALFDAWQTQTSETTLTREGLSVYNTPIRLLHKRDRVVWFIDKMLNAKVREKRSFSLA